ncbi:sugar porter family MFS transporter [Salinimicrobium sediminilitoris]|uniref:sugar porter family MFS transporter n=1 Tax=Salinimicrobium sediminilitoris TaxID=2876715 RepID=UPI001E2D6A8E|nr:sugar porter family MFS transporter [Salinimicrobium sediminilitoris]MCC8360637.1 sugar porter family MFS transporter [Salinimicrobium sediminilitoris]
MNSSKLYYWSIVVALAGFLFGFDTVVISGADKQLQALWGTSDLFHGLVVMSMALWGTVLGAIFGSFPTNKFGRKHTLIGIGILYFISAVGSAYANDPYLFAFFRFLGGIGVGVSTIAAPSYVSEIAPAAKRGRLVALYQFNIVFGILIAYLSNFLLKDMGEQAWRWMIGVEAFPALIYTILVFTVPESPRWLIIYRNKAKKAKEILELIYPLKDAETELAIIVRDHEKESRQKSSIFQPKYSFPLMLAFFIAFFNQFSGINAFLYYAPRIFEMSGLEESSALLSSVGIGVINLIFTLIGVALIDKMGRKKLMYIGSVGYIISLGLVTLAFQQSWPGMYVPVFFFLFIASHAIGQGAVIWVFISEIFPNHLRANGQSFGSSVHWVLAALIPSFIPFLFDTIGAPVVFGIFTFMMVLQLLWVKFYMPETKGQELEFLSENISGSRKKAMVEQH